MAWEENDKPADPDFLEGTPIKESQLEREPTLIYDSRKKKEKVEEKEGYITNKNPWISIFVIVSIVGVLFLPLYTILNADESVEEPVQLVQPEIQPEVNNVPFIPTNWEFWAVAIVIGWIASRVLGAFF